MLKSDHVQLAAFDVLSLNQLRVPSNNLPLNLTTGVDANTVPSTFPINFNGDRVAAVAPVSIALSSAGEGGYPVGAPWPVCRGSGNKMSSTTNLAGPGSALASFTLISSAETYARSSPVIDANGYVYIINKNTASNVVNLRKYSPPTVTPVATYTTNTLAFNANDTMAYYCPTLGANNVIYFMTTLGLHAVDTTTMTALWVNPLSNYNYHFLPFILLDQEGNVYGGSLQQLFCVTPAGVTKWITSVPLLVNSIALDSVTGVLYAWCIGLQSDNLPCAGCLKLFDSTTGTPLTGTPFTNFTTNSSTNPSSLVNNYPVIIGNTYVYAFFGGEACFAAFTKSGDVAWVFPNLYYNYGPVSCFYAYNSRLNIVYITNVTLNTQTTPGKYDVPVVTALDGDTGLVLYKTELPPINLATGQVLSPFMIIDSANNLYVFTGGATTIYVYRFDLTVLVTVTSIAADSFALDSAGHLLVGNSTGLYISN